MEVDLQGRLQKLSISKRDSIKAVYEAIANAFDSTDGMGSNGQIKIRILRGEGSRPSFPINGDEPPFKGYAVEDNGQGFTEENLTHFCKSDTMHKPTGKGVGRLLWIKVFKEAVIHSTYTQDSKLMSRKFRFTKKDGVKPDEAKHKLAEPGETIRTEILLHDPIESRTPFLDYSADKIAEKIIEHFLIRFLLGKQSVTVKDDARNQEIDLNALFHSSFEDRIDPEIFEVDGQTFKVHHVFVKPSIGDKNSVYLCAAGRAVEKFSVADIVSEVSKKDRVNADGQRYHAYVEGDYLDLIANDARGMLDFPSDDEDDLCTPTESEGIPRTKLMGELALRIRAKLSSHICQMQQEKIIKTKKFVQDSHPQYMPYLNDVIRDVANLPVHLTDKSIELALHEKKIENRERRDKLVEQLLKNKSIEKTQAARVKLVEQFTQEANRANVSALAEYVCSRKAVLDVLEGCMRHNEFNKYPYEKEIHDIFFPRFQTSETIEPHTSEENSVDLVNLWLIDERLAFHSMMTSDLPLSQSKVAVDECDDGEPDLIVFNPAYITSEASVSDLQAVAIIEFKRPNRNDYAPGSKKNPIEQVISLASTIRKTGIVTDKHEIIPVPPSLRIYAYIICDLTETLVEISDSVRSMQKTPDGLGRWEYHTVHNMYIEIIPYNKLIKDAKRRNMAFFKKLGIS